MSSSIKFGMNCEIWALSCSLWEKGLSGWVQNQNVWHSSDPDLWVLSSLSGTLLWLWPSWASPDLTWTWALQYFRFYVIFQVSDTGRFLTVFYLILLLPILLLYRTLSKEKQNDRMAADEEEIKSLMWAVWLRAPWQLSRQTRHKSDEKWR